MSKHIAIIGGTSGIGWETLKRLKSQGHALHVACRSSEKLAELDIQPQLFDALSPSSLVWPEKLDGLIYFPGTIQLKPFHRLTAEDFQKDFQVNLLGAVAALQSALPALKASGNASVVLFSTVAVSQGMPMHASIASAKGAVEGLTRSLAAEWAPVIRVNAIAPSLTDTPLAAGLLNSDLKKEASAKRHPLQRIGSPDEFAELTEFLLSDAARFMTGQIIHVDGGLSSVKLF
ncbi:SDR family oxidoreductase [bacterium]|jgi:NAD(P)-dependent dehydrogenase (short-subunit alcohol dehydrogenase family)|nr:SDR family oxidoreductase [Opitutae bacterium]NBY41939.1 SDR family oxidoreductase [Verrucomicrobiota bacterium]NDD70464.1 SDR family oxidoreductase [bacterium]